MAPLPPLTNAIADKIYAAYEQREQSFAPRPHLGASVMGHYCERYIWLTFRWAIREKFAGRMLRLFQRGQREETIIVNDLRAAGLEIRDFDPKTRRQYNIKDGHLGGSLDGIIFAGVPEAPKKKHIAEFKTHNLKSFDDLVKNGVEKSKPQHFAQMQVYMHYMDIDRALYVAVCKNDDRIHTERVRYDKAAATKIIERAKRIATADTAPPPISTDPTWFECRFCPAHAMCHKQDWTREVNCRTCAHSTAQEAGSWHCAKWDTIVPTPEAQFDGCDHHVLHPDLVPWPMKRTEDGESVIYVIDGKDIQNGFDGYKSREIVINPTSCDHPVVKEVKRLFPDAEIVG